MSEEINLSDAAAGSPKKSENTPVQKKTSWIRRYICTSFPCLVKISQILQIAMIVTIVFMYYQYRDERKLRSFNALTQWKELQLSNDIQALTPLINADDKKVIKKIIKGDWSDSPITVSPEEASIIHLFMKQEYRQILDEDIFIQKAVGDQRTLTQLTCNTISNKIMDYIELYEFLCVFWNHDFGYTEILEEQFVFTDPITGKKELSATLSSIGHILRERNRGYEEFPNIVRVIRKYQ